MNQTSCKDCAAFQRRQISAGLHRPIECTASDLMRVRRTPAATDDLRNIANYLFEKTPEHAPV